MLTLFGSVHAPIRGGACTARPQRGYTSGMPSPPSSAARPPNGGDPPDQSLPEPERFGPLLLLRLVKPDGRALILFSRADGPPSDAGEER
jgi:hypothetical protein